ncbi:Uncharacterized protein OBRU01_14823 [Operophtera brumata]|uniref:Uncharacterized protein n=1 Tax=Operophtera brumata TaxID=104452 RepID=A0A0L7L6G8_OPEBR|nr:Uncharacterized protein OBRU01_14823 [Operophtera brumata]
MPWIGTFQYRFKGFQRQPADHYLRPFYLEEFKNGKKWWGSKSGRYCVGSTLTYKLMMNITEQSYLESACLYANVRNTLQGKFEERMPLMAIRLPEILKRSRPGLAAILQNNSQVLTTPHDIHATILDAMGLERYRSDYKIRGADLSRGLSLFKPIPNNRSCSEAGIEPHWCACVAWDYVPQSEAIYKKIAEAFVEYINSLTQPVSGARDHDGYVGNFDSKFDGLKDYYQIKVSRTKT